MARERATQDVNTVLIDLYWKVGEIISHKIEAAEWGDRVVDRLAQFIARTESGLRGFIRRNLFRMRQFYEAYRNDSKVSPLVTQMYPEALSVFRDAYTVKFLRLPCIHAETDLHRGLLEKLKDFLIELERDFCFVGPNIHCRLAAKTSRSICCSFTGG